MYFVLESRATALYALAIVFVAKYAYRYEAFLPAVLEYSAVRTVPTTIQLW